MSEVNAIGPDWDMTAWFPEFRGKEYTAFREHLARDVASLQERVHDLSAIDSSSVRAWAAFLVDLEGVAQRAAHLASYLGCVGAADAIDEEIKRETASAAAARVELDKVYVSLRAALTDVDDADFEQLCAEPSQQAVRFFLTRIRERARFSMEPELEGLSAELGIDGLSAWGRLYDRISGSLEFDFEPEGEPARKLPVSMTRTLLEDPNPAVRRAALSGSNAAWSSVAEPLAASLNAIAGTRLTLYRRRSVAHFLDPALFDAAISQRTLAALFEAVEARAELPRAYLRRKAGLLGQQHLGFQDLMAPLPLEDRSRIAWADGCARVVDAFGAGYPDLARFAEMAIERRWIDHSPRPGKRPGGFCSTSGLCGESRIFITYNGAAGDVSTLAHELGHAWHGWLMRDLRTWARRYPMTLAETASTFAENLVIEATLEDPRTSAEERLFTLDARLQDAAAYLLNIWMRFRFERALYEERASGELGVQRLKELMQQAQQDCYGDALDSEQLDPWFWASKLHFYITGLSFYNFPYMFGYLFSLGIFARAREEGADFLPRYEALLRDTGRDTAEGVARRHLGVDLETPEFWNASIDLIERDWQRFTDACGDTA
jgi:oligoendopeptidase F